MSNSEARKETRVILAIAVVIALIFVLAAYGYFTGAWEWGPSS
jgi:hypothetical protein